MNRLGILQPGVNPRALWIRDVERMTATIENEIEQLKANAHYLEGVVFELRFHLEERNYTSIEEILGELDEYLKALGR